MGSSRPRVTNRDIDDIIRLAKRGMTAAEIAAELNITRHRVYYIRDRHGIDMRTTKSCSPETIAEIRRLRADGKSNDEIANATGVCVWTVTKYATRETDEPEKSAV